MQKIQEYTYEGKGLTRVFENEKWMVGIKNWKPEEPVDDTEWKEGHTRWGCSLVGGIGAIMNNGIFVDLRYNYGLTSALKDWKSKNRSLELSVGYMF